MRASQTGCAPVRLLIALLVLSLASLAFAGGGADLSPSFDLGPDLEVTDIAEPPPPPPTSDAGAAVPMPASVPSEPPGDRESLLTLAREDIEALGPLSLGTPDSGLLLNPVPMPEGPLWTIRDPDESWGTSETMGFIATAITAVERRYPGSPLLLIGDISRPDGGRLNRHRSHQAGRDVDLGFYYLHGECGEFRVARKNDLDLPRTWALLRALVTETDVERVFLDRRLQAVLYGYALAEGEDRGWLDDIFGRLGDGRRKGIIQHERRHKNHLHVRFFSPVAQERARIVYATLVEAGSVPPPMVRHRVRRGETLGHLAASYGTRASAIRAANGLRGNRLRAGRRYLIPIRRVPVDGGPLVIPPRRLPPSATRAADSPLPASGLITPTGAR